jgi:DNA-binding NtrC family response regulator
MAQVLLCILSLETSNPANYKFTPLKKSRMKMKILVMNANVQESKNLCSLLNQHHFLTAPIDSISKLETTLKDSGYAAAIVDLDTIPISNRHFKSLSTKYPGIRLLCMSTKQFHPELQDAISHYIYACLKKPVDTDELFFWLKSIYEEKVS